MQRWWLKLRSVGGLRSTPNTHHSLLPYRLLHTLTNPIVNRLFTHSIRDPSFKSISHISFPTHSSLPLSVNLNKMFWSKPHSLALAPDSPFRVEDPQYEGFKRFIFKLMLFYSKQSKSIRGANVIYRRVIHQVDRPAIYDVFSLEKTFKTTFSLLVIHMWLCLRRLKQDGKEGVELGQYLYEIYNHDVELRVSKAGTAEKGQKRLSQLSNIDLQQHQGKWSFLLDSHTESHPDGRLFDKKKGVNSEGSSSEWSMEVVLLSLM